MASAPNRWSAGSGNFWKNLKRVAGAVIIYNVGSSFYQTYRVFKEFVTLPAAFYLELDLEQQTLVERLSSNPLSLITAGLHQLELQGLIQALHSAKSDERVRGVMAILGGRENFAGVAQIQELRNALLDFRFTAKGRAPIYAYTNTFGEGGLNATGLYYLASAADKLYMPPTSCLSLLGLESTQVFVRGLLDKLKIEPEVYRRKEYKSAMAPIMEKGFDPPHRENITSLLQCIHNQVVDGIAAARRVSPEDVQSAISAAPLLPSMAMQMKLLDGLLYRDQVEQLLLQQLPSDVQEAVQQTRSTPPGPRQKPPSIAQLAGPRVTLHRYTTATAWAKQSAELWGSSSSSNPPSNPPPHDHPAICTDLTTAVTTTNSSDTAHQPQQQQQPVPGEPGGQQSLQQQLLQQRFIGPSRGNMNKPWVAVVTAVGPIVQTSSDGGSPMGGDTSIESHKLVRVLKAIRENPQFKAVVLRINSPGGSAVASDVIAREVTLLREAGKPVVACMGDVAASGGYYIAAPANKIMAQPGTITGSIGVIFARFKAKEALEEYGITSDTVLLGNNANWASPFHTLTPKQKQQIESLLDATYDNFLSEVARGRKLDKDIVKDVAKGRIWTGSQALEIGLVDELGGVTRALEVAKELAGLPQDPASTQVLEWPTRRIPPWLMLAQSRAMPGSADPLPAAAQLAAAKPSLVQTVTEVYPIFAEAAAKTAAAAGLMRMFIRTWLQTETGSWLEDGVLAGDQESAVRQIASALGLQRQQHQQQAQLTQALAVAVGGVAGSSSVAHVGSGALVSHSAFGTANAFVMPDMLCLEADLLAFSC